MITDNYSVDYLGDEILDLYRAIDTLKDMLDSGTFEWDTYDTDTALYQVKEAINRIDI